MPPPAPSLAQRRGCLAHSAISSLRPVEGRLSLLLFREWIWGPTVTLTWTIPHCASVNACPSPLHQDPPIYHRVCEVYRYKVLPALPLVMGDSGQGSPSPALPLTAPQVTAQTLRCSMKGREQGGKRTQYKMWFLWMWLRDPVFSSSWNNPEPQPVQLSLSLLTGNPATPPLFLLCITFYLLIESLSSKLKCKGKGVEKGKITWIIITTTRNDRG